MATIVLDYDAHDVRAQKALDFMLSSGLFKEKRKKTGIEEAFEDIEKGRVTRIYTPKNWKGEKA